MGYQAVVAKMVLQGSGITVLSSSTLASGTVVAIAPAALVVAIDKTPRFTIGEEAVVHHDTVPEPIGTIGVPPPNAVAAPSRSLWQTDCVSARIILNLGWAERAAGAVAVANGVAW